MTAEKTLRVAALIDLPRSAEAGGHVKCWERLAAAAAEGGSPLDLTVYFSGRESTETLGPQTRIRQLPPVFSTKTLKFLPYVPDHTDLAPFHPRLARELPDYDVIHTTDGFFAFARTAARVSLAHNIPLVTSFHTDTPAYARIFTRRTIEKIFGWPGGRMLARKMIEDWRLPEKQEKTMEDKLRRHLRHCRYALVTRAEDQALAESILGSEHVRLLRLGVDKAMFGPHRADRAGIEADYGIPPGRIVLLFVGRVDIGKNVQTLAAAMEKLLAQGVPLHLVVAGKGPAAAEVKSRLGRHASLPGFIAPQDLARLYASVDGLALCSEVEIRSMAGVEAMASGCPALVSEKSGIAQLFNYTPAMHTVASGMDAWAGALGAFAADPARRAAMRTEASEYGHRYLAGWQDVLAEDLFAIWQRAAVRTDSAHRAA
ncbi:MAG TPA: glycosyltransferase [Alphaproteobacteria bacterium]|nr:glycosyltransferase [Alphaproteobacteria bacterium]